MAGPSITNIYPGAGTAVQANSPLVLTFNEALQPQSVAVTLQGPSGTFTAKYTSGTVTVINNVLLVHGAFGAAGNYHVTISASALVDLAGNAASNDINLDVTVPAGPDTTAPALVAALPTSADGAIAPGGSPRFIFSEFLTRGTGNIELHYADGTLIESVPASQDVPIGSQNYAARSGEQILFTAPNDLHSGTGYYYYFPAGSFTDSSGNPIAAFRYDFTTSGVADATAPVLASSSPAGNATGVSLLGPLIFTFNEAILFGSGTIEIHKALDGSLVSTADINDTYRINNTSSTSFAVNANRLFTKGYVPLDPATDYYITLSPGIVHDPSGNNFAGITDPQQLHFTTAPVAHLSSSSSPVTVTASADLPAGQTIALMHANQTDSQFALHVTSGVDGVFNYGTIRITSTISSVAYGVVVDYFNSNFKNYGLIEAINLPDPVGSLTPAALGIDADASYLLNGKTGVIRASGDKAYGIWTDGGDGALINEGQIEVHGNDLSIGIDVFQNAQSITNTGTITVVGTLGENTYGIAAGFPPVTPIINSGTIDVSAATHNNLSVAIANDGSGTLINHGRISAGIAYLEEGFYGFDTTIQNDGTIIGDMFLLGGTDKITNTGTITGTISMLGGPNPNTFDGRGGAYSGSLSTGFGNDQIWAGSGNAIIKAGTGNDAIDGGAGIDTAVFSGNRSAYTITQASTGHFTISGTDGTDTLVNIEYAQFDDQTVRLLPGSGTSVNFSTAPSTYLSAIRDFDGNDVGSAGSWVLLGTTDVNHSGSQSHIYVNSANGRWAEVGTASDGMVYFDDHGWAGTTRVVGIYIDPLVQAGAVQAGSANDSQRRFQNDLQIGNIAGILGSGDYDGDGFQEIYFRLTDGTAYLHAYMWGDGNIRYANYQSAQQVKDYLTAHGVGASSWGSWFSADTLADMIAPGAIMAAPIASTLDPFAQNGASLLAGIAV